MTILTKDFDIQGASCRVWLSGTPTVRDLKTAAIGAFTCDTAASGAKLLGQVEDALVRDGFRYLVGPMDGTTWQKYRFVLDGDDSPPFLMEPWNPPHFPEAFREAGFACIAEYASARATEFRLRGMESYAARLAQAGISVRPFDAAQAERELAKMYALSIAAFARNFLYTPISQNEFLDLYRPVLGKLVPDYVLMAENDAGNLQAFLFAIPDLAQGPQPDQLIIKTYASRYPGLGAFLAERIHAQALADGYRSVIHALMHLDNKSKRNSEKYGGTFRRYGLFGREVAP